MRVSKQFRGFPKVYGGKINPRRGQMPPPPPPPPTRAVNLNFLFIIFLAYNVCIVSFFYIIYLLLNEYTYILQISILFSSETL